MRTQIIRIQLFVASRGGKGMEKSRISVLFVSYIYIVLDRDFFKNRHLWLAPAPWNVNLLGAKIGANLRQTLRKLTP
jgi:hypothetical protein